MFAITYSASQRNDFAQYTPMVMVDDEFQYMYHMAFENKDGFRGCVFWNGNFYVAGGSVLYKISRDFNPEKTLQIGRDNHGLTLYRDFLYLVSTDESAVYRLDADLNVLEKIEAKTVLGEPLSRGIHINSVAFLQEFPIFTAHNGNGEGYIYMATGQNNVILARHLEQPHDFRWVADGYVYLNSQKKEICCHRMPIERCWVQQLPEYARGLEIVGEMAYVGCSGRGNSYNCIVGIDLVSGDITGQWDLPSNFGVEIYSVVKQQGETDGRSS